MDIIISRLEGCFHQFMSNCYMLMHEYCGDRELKATLMKKAYTHALKTDSL